MGSMMFHVQRCSLKSSRTSWENSWLGIKDVVGRCTASMIHAQVGCGLLLRVKHAKPSDSQRQNLAADWQNMSHVLLEKKARNGAYLPKLQI